MLYLRTDARGANYILWCLILVMHNISILLCRFPYLDHHTYILEDIILFIYLFGVGLGGGGGRGELVYCLLWLVHCTWGICTVSLSVSYLLEANGWVWLASQQFVVLSPAVKVFGFREHIAFEESQIWRRGWFCFPLLL